MILPLTQKGGGAPAPFDHGVSLGDATPPQPEWPRAKTDWCLRTGAWARARRRRRLSRVFLVPKPGAKKRRLVMDFRWLGSHCVKSQCKMETRKQLQRRAKPDDWCFSFDLQDCVGIEPDFQSRGAVSVRRSLLWVERLPSYLRQADAGASGVPAFTKVRSGTTGGAHFGVAARCADRGQVAGELEGAGASSTSKVPASKLPCMDDFLALASSKVEALRARELASLAETRHWAEREEGAAGARCSWGNAVWRQTHTRDSSACGAVNRRGKRIPKRDFLSHAGNM
ncbi:hypothetical protein CYMTET_33999 [Cymbomonas tetramitiformis]|uniref:Uncharacterized protein n=1 Tax=Cymbomonas tetramitiformis TaxID=36881 RepID=A0AAE0KQB5_9CHLO|nr:hypothetical protein CYMTET_33999 [Cymbomonas tetramitiformis]